MTDVAEPPGDDAPGPSEFLYSRKFERSWAKTASGLYIGLGLGFREDGFRLSYYSEKPIPWAWIDSGISSGMATLINLRYFGIAINFPDMPPSEFGYPITRRAGTRGWIRNQYRFYWLCLAADDDSTLVNSVKYYKEKYTGDDVVDHPD